CKGRTCSGFGAGDGGVGREGDAPPARGGAGTNTNFVSEAAIARRGLARATESAMAAARARAYSRNVPARYLAIRRSDLLAEDTTIFSNIVASFTGHTSPLPHGDRWLSRRRHEL